MSGLHTPPSSTNRSALFQERLIVGRIIQKNFETEETLRQFRRKFKDELQKLARWMAGKKRVGGDLMINRSVMKVLQRHFQAAEYEIIFPVLRRTAATKLIATQPQAGTQEVINEKGSEIYFLLPFGSMVLRTVSEGTNVVVLKKHGGEIVDISLEKPQHPGPLVLWRDEFGDLSIPVLKGSIPFLKINAQSVADFPSWMHKELRRALDADARIQEAARIRGRNKPTRSKRMGKREKEAYIVLVRELEEAISLQPQYVRPAQTTSAPTRQRFTKISNEELYKLAAAAREVEKNAARAREQAMPHAILMEYLTKQAVSGILRQAADCAAMIANRSTASLAKRTSEIEEMTHAVRKLSKTCEKRSEFIAHASAALIRKQSIASYAASRAALLAAENTKAAKRAAHIAERARSDAQKLATEIKRARQEQDTVRTEIASAQNEITHRRDKAIKSAKGVLKAYTAAQEADARAAQAAKECDSYASRHGEQLPADPKLHSLSSSNQEVVSKTARQIVKQQHLRRQSIAQSVARTLAGAPASLSEPQALCRRVAENLAETRRLRRKRLARERGRAVGERGPRGGSVHAPSGQTG